MISENIPIIQKLSVSFYRYTKRFFFKYIHRIKIPRNQLCLTLCNCMDCSLPGSLQYTPWSSPGKNTGVGCHFFLQGIFPTKRLDLGLLHCRQILYHLNHQGSPKIRENYQRTTSENILIIQKFSVLFNDTPKGFFNIYIE